MSAAGFGNLGQIVGGLRALPELGNRARHSAMFAMMTRDSDPAHPVFGGSVIAIT